MICPRCGGKGQLVSYEFRAWGIMDPHTLYKCECLCCGFVAHPSGTPKGAEEFFTKGLTRDPRFDPWREIEAKINTEKATV